MNEKTKIIEARMLFEAKQSIANERHILDLVDATIRRHIMEILGYGDFGTDAWLISPCSYIGGARPVDVIRNDPTKVIEAAVHKANWKNPG